MNGETLSTGRHAVPRVSGGPSGESAGAKRSRLRRQRRAFAALDEGPAKERLRRAILDRAEELLQINPEAADALLEFMPHKDRDDLLAGFFDS
jgi:hypothetical protein